MFMHHYIKAAQLANTDVHMLEENQNSEVQPYWTYEIGGKSFKHEFYAD